MILKKYEKLKTQYPEYISLEQFVKICKVSKKSARYLVRNNIVPAIDSGKATWRYKIHIDDVITYLHRKAQWGNPIPKGEANSRETKRRKSFSQIVSAGEAQKVAEYFEEIYADFPDVLTTADMAAMTGLNADTLRQAMSDGHIKYLISSGKRYVPKVYFWKFLTSRRFIEMWSNSDEFIRILEGFEEWKSR